MISELESAITTMRRAATLLREQAELATDGPWEASRGPLEDLHFGVMDTTRLDAPSHNLFAVAGLSIADADYMATMDPDAGLLVADMLDSAAGSAEVWLKWAPHLNIDVDAANHLVEPPLALARAILREE